MRRTRQPFRLFTYKFFLLRCRNWRAGYRYPGCAKKEVSLAVRLAHERSNLELNGVVQEKLIVPGGDFLSVRHPRACICS